MRAFVMATFVALLAMPAVARAAAPGECGQFHYDSNGRCVDARNKAKNYWDACGYASCERVYENGGNPQ